MVYRVDVDVESRVVLDLLASYSNSMVSLYRGCAEARVAGGRGLTRIDRVLSPDTYYAIVGGDDVGDEGAYTLNATLLPTGF